MPDEATRKGREMRAICSEHPDEVFLCEEGGTRVGFVQAVMD